jgi:hypothetical protein
MTRIPFHRQISPGCHHNTANTWNARPSGEIYLDQFGTSFLASGRAMIAIMVELTPQTKSK